jgi:curved DNA-binding protein CbpA
MNYYRYLGVAPSASTEEIRAAYRNLVRLMHPDRQREAALRLVAEEQLRHLNEVMEVLVDPGRRRRYDRSLRVGAEVRCGLRMSARAALRTVPVRAAAVALLIGAPAWWIFRDGGATSPRGLRRPAAGASPAVAGPAPERPPAGARKAAAPAPRRAQPRGRRAAAVAAPAGGTAAPDGPGEPRLPDPPALQAAARPLPAGPRTARLAAPPERFAGTWFYVKEPDSAGIPYPPEYIEATIVEEQGTLRGRYRGVYRVRDRAISSEVAFEFQGRAQARTAHLEWRGGGESRGQALLRILSDGSLEMSWWAAGPANPTRLGSGTARLVRRSAP